MNRALDHLPEYKQRQLMEIAEIIFKAVDTEKVILFGRQASGRKVEYLYIEAGFAYEYISDYDILVITKSGESRIDYQNTNDPVVNNWFRSSPGDIQNADAKPREKSDKGLSYIHHGPIDSGGKFWGNLRGLINQKVGNGKIADFITNALRQNPNIKVTIQ